jgi:hypothetical protein
VSLPVYFIKAERYVRDPNGVPKLCPVTLEIGMHFTGSIAYVKEIGAPETPNASRETGK